ncbi:hypothetical protein [Caenispirillum salinarum]|uniref:hypothetical protein n=1 Tax=Caenispirillum salinarum TaxID=859058 RepID=UPI00384F60AB
MTATSTPKAGRRARMRGATPFALALVSLAAYVLLNEGLRNHLADMRAVIAAMTGG